jgi:DNA-binding transcriptional LysR family regulator
VDTIDQMRAFATAVATGSFTQAAERLGTTPQLISKYVKGLEAQLGARLINRTTRSMSLTETGRAYHTRCLQLLEDFDELHAAVRNEQSRPQGLLRVTAPSTFGEMYLTPAIGDFVAAHPEVRVDLHLTDRFVGLVDEGIDVAVRIGELTDSSVIARRLAAAPIVACAAPAYLEAAGRPREPRDLTDHACIVDTNFRVGDSWPFLVAGKRETVRVEGQLRVNSAPAVRDLALRGFGVALCPTYVVGEDVRAGRLEALLEEFNAFDLGLFAVYSERRHLSAKIRAFVDFLGQRFAHGLS